MVYITPTQEIAASLASFSAILIPKVEFVVRSVFIVFASVLIGRLIIEEYSNKTISVLFMYPISRKVLMVSKLVIVVMFTFLSAIFSNILITGMLYLLNIVYPILRFDLTVPIVIKSLYNFLMSAIATSGMSLIPLYFGMRKKSTTSAILSAILMVVLLRIRIGGLSFNSIAAISISLATIGICIAYLSIRDIEHRDVNV
jgi:ABC-type transport system involved in multi-copper enzyme maturation permease subunit